MADLLSRDVDPTGIMSLLTPFVTGGALPPPAPDAAPDPQAQALAGAAATPAWLAFARVMGQAAQPRYGPAAPIGPALADAMSAGYGTAVQAEQLPLIRASLGLSLQQRQLDYNRQQFEFGREQAMWNAFGPMMLGMRPGAAPDQSTGGQPGAAALPPSGFGPPASSQALSALPEIQAIPDTVTRLRVMQTLLDAGASLPAAQQWARQLKVESGFQQTGKDGATLASDKGALGIGQVMPATFTAMAKAHPDITGDINDIGSNLKASYYYFNDGLKAANGNLGGAAAYYVGGDDGLAGWQHGNPSAQVADYVTRTGAAPAPTSAPSGNASALGPMVQTPFGQVPQNVWTEALFAGAGDPAHFPEIVAGKINDYQQKQYTPGALPGQQIGYGGKIDVAPRPTRTVPMTADEVASDSTLDPRFSWYKTIYTDDGTMAKPPEAAAPRQAMAQIQQETDLRNEYLKDPTVQTYQAMLPYYTRMQGIEAATMGPNAEREPQLADDYALLHNFAHIQDPSIGTSQEREAALYQGAGVPGMIKQAYATVMGGGKLTAEQRQWLLDTAKAEMGGQEAQAYQVLQEKRRVAAGTGLRPDQIAIPWNLSDPAKATLAATPPGARTPGTPTAPAYTGAGVPRPGVVIPGTPTPVPGVTAPLPAQPTAQPRQPTAPAPQTPAQPTAQQPATQQAQATQPTVQIDPASLHGMSKQAFQKVIDDMRANGERYSPALRLAIGAELANRVQKGNN